MDKFIIAAAQSNSIKGDIETNVQIHLDYIKKAIENNTDVILFPELSLTGYEPQLAKELSMDIDDSRLRPLKDLALQNKITIIAGAPIINRAGKPYIGALIISPEKSSVYKKQYLHPGEDKYFSPGDKDCVTDIKEQRIGLAICADIAKPAHPEAAALNNASIYAAGVLITKEGYSGDAFLLQNYAKRFNINVVMANYCQSTGGFIPAGKSSIWNANGELMAIADESNKCLIVAKKESNKWTGSSISI